MSSYKLWCIIEGNSTPFLIIAPSTTYIAELKGTIKERMSPLLERVASLNLALWKPKETICVKPSEALAERVRNWFLEADISQFAEKLEPTDLVAKVFQDLNSEPELNIIVRLPQDPLDQRAFKRPRLSTPSRSHSLRIPSASLSARTNTVSALYERLKRYPFILVRGTPASGKTTLTRLLAQHIREQEPAVHIIPVSGWPLEKVEQCGGWQVYLEHVKGWIQGKRTFFIFDEAQSSYEDFELWGEFFKDIEAYNNLFVIAFAVYGSPTTSPIIQRIPFSISDSQRVTLRRIDHGDGLDPVGLLFSRMEFDDLVRKQFPSPEHYFHSSFFDNIFVLTGGHVGAIHDLVKVIVSHDSYRELRRTPGRVYTWDVFLAKVNLRDLVVKLDKSASVFIRGLPRDEHLKKPGFARVFSKVLCEGRMVESKSVIGEDATALRRCFYNGWLHADKHRNNNNEEETVYVFPSPLHRWFVEWKLWDTVPAIPFEANSILQLAVEVISKFCPRLLSTERRIGPGCIQRLPEAQYQDEFYRCCHAYSNGSLVTFPEFGTAKGRVDFYIPSKKWGVELLRDYDQLEQHSGRFSRSGLYGTSLQLEDYIILDCRNTSPTRGYPNTPKLYHVVFSYDYQKVCILDHLLQTVRGGELRLLSSL